MILFFNFYHESHYSLGFLNRLELDHICLYLDESGITTFTHIHWLPPIGETAKASFYFLHIGSESPLAGRLPWKPVKIRLNLYVSM